MAPDQAYTPQIAASMEVAQAELAAEEEAARAAAEAATALSEQRPEWTLTGVILGSPRLAILDGPRAGEGGVFAPGDLVDGFTVAEILADRVVITRGEQAWTFALTPPWS
jgi:hypothetical protein